jgi:hypothetical protein
MAEPEVQDFVKLYPCSGDEVEIEFAKKHGFWIEPSYSNNVCLKFVNGGYKIRDVPDYVIWQTLITTLKRLKRVEDELQYKGRAAVKRERRRVEKLLQRAYKEMSIHEHTMMLAVEISNNPDAERVLFGCVEIT